MYAGSGQFLVLTDIHLDLHFGSEQAFGPGSCKTSSAPEATGLKGCDCPLTLLEVVLSHAAVATKPDFILVLGDALRHGMDQLPNGDASRRTSIAQITALLDDKFSSKNRVHTPTLVTIGNNDVIPGMTCIIGMLLCYPSLE